MQLWVQVVRLLSMEAVVWYGKILQHFGPLFQDGFLVFLLSFFETMQPVQHVVVLLDLIGDRRYVLVLFLAPPFHFPVDSVVLSLFHLHAPFVQGRLRWLGRSASQCLFRRSMRQLQLFL